MTSESDAQKIARLEMRMSDMQEELTKLRMAVGPALIDAIPDAHSVRLAISGHLNSITVLKRLLATAECKARQFPASRKGK